jgi:circadian clock protein KaiC
VTGIFTSLSLAADHANEADRGVSSLMDSWISLTHVESSGERNRLLCVLKARGMDHSNQLREYLLTSQGVQFVHPSVCREGVLTGAARLAQAARERGEILLRDQAMDRRRRDRDRDRASMERKIQGMRAVLEAEEAELIMLMDEEKVRESAIAGDRVAMATRRGVAK